ncbi:MAG: fructosamine kinase family protein, partial [Nocardioides sp.]|uniref:fructosamine kinase family protein n=1 Tax=Nocardioides sp. TaxID=35761 RepID=UPI003EFC936F
MTRQPGVARRAEELLGSKVVSTAPVAGGDISTAVRLRLTNGHSALMKTLHGAPDDFYATEADGLRWLAVPGGVPVPEVLAVTSDCLILEWVEPGTKHPSDAATEFGQRLARTHLAGADGWGLDRDGYIGRLPMRSETSPSWPEFYAVRRVLP